MQVCPVCRQLGIGESFHQLPRHERAQRSSIRSHACANHFHKISLTPFSKLTTRREIRCRRITRARSAEVVAVTSFACTRLYEVLPILNRWSLGNWLAIEIRRNELSRKEWKSAEEVYRAPNRPNRLCRGDGHVRRRKRFQVGD